MNIKTTIVEKTLPGDFWIFYRFDFLLKEDIMFILPLRGVLGMEIFGRIGSFLKETRQEMKKVTWLSWKETWQKTLIVIGVSIAVAIFLGGLDALFTWLVHRII